MPNKDPRVDAYIRKAAPFAAPILLHLRQIVHRSCPKAEETLKWGMPQFLYEGKILCSMAAFKSHCTFGFWNGAHIVKPSGEKAGVAMGQLGRLTTLADLPSERVLATYVKQAVKLSQAGASPIKSRVRTKKPPLRAPADFLRALRANRKALAVYEAFSPGRQREYVEWVTEAKTAETRERRLETAVEWLSEGKSRNWKYGG